MPSCRQTNSVKALKAPVHQIKVMNLLLIQFNLRTQQTMQLSLRAGQSSSVLTCLECVLVTKRSSHLDIHGADQTVCGQSADKTSVIMNHIFTRTAIIKYDTIKEIIYIFLYIAP